MSADQFEMDPENNQGPDIVVDNSTYSGVVWLTVGMEIRDLKPKEARKLAKALKAHADAAERDEAA